MNGYLNLWYGVLRAKGFSNEQEITLSGGVIVDTDGI